MENLDIIPRISQKPQGTSRPGISHIGLGSVQQRSTWSIPSGVPAAEPDSSMLLKAVPVEPVIFNPCIYPPANYHIDIRFLQRDGGGSTICRRIQVQTVMFNIWSQWKASCLQIDLHDSFFWISVTKLRDVIIRLCMCKGRMHLVKVLESKLGYKTAMKFAFFLKVTIKWQSKRNISDKMCQQNWVE
jgi:hypothetical protein